MNNRSHWLVWSGKLTDKEVIARYCALVGRIPERLHLGMSEEEIIEVYLNKNKENFRRQKEHLLYKVGQNAPQND